MKINLKLIVLASILASFSLGCETIDFEEMMKPPEDTESKPKTVMSVHKIVKYPRALDLEKEIIAFSGRKVWINKNPFLHSRHIQDIQLIPCEGRPNYFNLRLKLDRSGKIMWIALCEQTRINEFGVVVDGIYYRLFKPERIFSEESDWVVLNGPYDKISANSLKDNAKNNYKLLNR